MLLADLDKRLNSLVDMAHSSLSRELVSPRLLPRHPRPDRPYGAYEEPGISGPGSLQEPGYEPIIWGDIFLQFEIYLYDMNLKFIVKLDLPDGQRIIEFVAIEGE